jgi:hypothetical protein
MHCGGCNRCAAGEVCQNHVCMPSGPVDAGGGPNDAGPDADSGLDAGADAADGG